LDKPFLLLAEKRNTNHTKNWKELDILPQKGFLPQQYESFWGIII